MPSLRTCVSAALLLAASSAFAADPPKPLRVLLVTGGCCHDYTRQKKIIADGLTERAHVEVTVVQQGGNGTHAEIPLYKDADWSKGYDLVIHNECFADDKDPKWTAGILKPHKEGLPGVVIHCAMHCYRDGTDQWFQFCGVTSRRHGAAYPHEVLNRDAEHPIMKGFGPAWANPAGELYWIEKVWPTAHPLASSKNKENGHDEVCVWTNQYEKGRVFGTTIGHHNETMEDPVFLNMLTRGSLWACDKLNDEYLKPVKAKTVRVNMARGMPVLASSEETGKGNVAANAVDGKGDTRWCANRADSGEWLQVDLGKATKVGGLKIDWESSDTSYKCKVEGSADGKQWKRLADFSTNSMPGPKDMEFPNGDGVRFVRVTFLGSSTASWGSIREIQVYGSDTTTLNEIDVRGEAERASLIDVKAPQGYELTLVASPPAVSYPVYVAAAPNGDLYVSSDKNGSLGRGPHRGSVIRLRDLDGDGRADESKRFVADVDSPRGLVWDHDRIYLMHPPHLSAFIDKDGDGVADEEKILVKNIAFTFKDRPADHTSNGVTLGIDGWLYLAIGDFGFMEAEGADGKKLQLRGGGVVRVRPDGSGLEVYSRGTRNILEVSMDPRLNGFVRDNTNDGGGWDIRLHHFSGMEHHGYPSLFKNFGDEIIQPLADYGGGSGCGGLFLSEPGFPDGDGDALYTADWGRERVFRHHVTPKGATFTADQGEFLTLPRVTDLDVDANSRIYASSWKGAVFDYAGENVGYIVRLSPKGYTPEPLPDFEKLSKAELVKQLESPSARRRLEAQRTLLRHGVDEATTKALTSLAADGKKPLDGRIAAIFAIKQGLGARSAEILANLEHDASILEYVVRAMGDRPDEIVGASTGPIYDHLRDLNPRVRLQAARAMVALRKKSLTRSLTLLLSDADPIVAHTTTHALIELGAAPECLAILERPSSTPGEKQGVLRVLQAIHTKPVVDGLIARLESEKDPATRRMIATALCRLYHVEGKWKGDSWGTRPDTSGPYYQPETWSESPKIAGVLKSTLDHASGDEAGALLRELTRHKIKLEGGLDAVIAMAAKDSSLLPSAISQLSGSDRIPPAAVALLVKAATANETAASVRSHAVVALAKVDSPESFAAILRAMPRIQSEAKGRPEFSQAKTAFLTASKLGNHHAFLEEAAAKMEGSEGAWADAALLVLLGDKSASPEAREAAKASLDSGWKEAKRRAQIVHAVSLAGYRPYAEKVVAAMTDPDASVASAAKSTAREMKLATGAKAALPKGPPSRQHEGRSGGPADHDDQGGSLDGRGDFHPAQLRELPHRPLRRDAQRPLPGQHRHHLQTQRAGRGGIDAEQDHRARVRHECFRHEGRQDALGVRRAGGGRRGDDSHPRRQGSEDPHERDRGAREVANLRHARRRRQPVDRGRVRVFAGLFAVSVAEVGFRARHFVVPEGPCRVLCEHLLIDFIEEVLAEHPTRPHAVPIVQFISIAPTIVSEAARPTPRASGVWCIFA